MKKAVFILIPFLLILTTVYAEEPKEPKIEGLIVLKNDWIPKPGNDIPCLSTHFKYKSLGGGFDLRYYNRGKVTEFQPYITMNKGPWYALVGYSVDANNVQYAQTGIWYIKNFGKLNILADVRNWWSLDTGKAKSYFDPFVQVLYPFPKAWNIDNKLYFGVEGEINHWWSGPSHNWYLIGPVVGCNITKNLAVFVRASHEWNVKEDVMERAYRIRTGLIVKF